ncbi:YihY/virulence factor BrkB family protein [Terrabacter sp. NPDC000476]|uniref:YihY/virulence factor BrkB family protein n=1 Tax=Terrabacter sp. NPDC000476 TaxID=3154258 RepID=UPI00332318F2
MNVRERVRAGLERVPWGVPLARLTLETIRVCLRYRVTGLAAEGAFFMLLSLPPLVLGLFGGLGFVGGWIGEDTVARIVSTIQVYASRFLTESSINELLLPTITDVLRGGRADIISVGFLLSLWSGSRALNVFIDTVSIMYGQKDARGIVHMRAFSLLLYTVGILAAIVVLPLMLLGPGILASWLPDGAATVTKALYWPTLVVFSVVLLAAMYHVSTPQRSPWRRNIPGAVLAMAIWVGASYVVRISLEASMGGSSIYGPLSTPIVLLVWLYALAVAILIGAGLNAAVRTLWPAPLHPGADVRLVNWAMEGAGGLLSRNDPSRADASTAPRTVDDAEPAAGIAAQARDQQYEHVEQGPIAAAVRRGVEEGAKGAAEASREASRGAARKG